MGNLLKGLIIIMINFLNPLLSLCKNVHLVELDAKEFINIATFPPKDDYVILFYANWNIASNQFQSTFLNVTQNVTINDLYNSSKEGRKIIFAKFSCGRYPNICSKYHLHNLPAILFFTNLVLHKSSDTGIPHSTRYPGNLNVYEQVQDFVELWRSIGRIVRLYNEYSKNLTDSWEAGTRRLNSLIKR